MKIEIEVGGRIVKLTCPSVLAGEIAAAAERVNAQLHDLDQGYEGVQGIDVLDLFVVLLVHKEVSLHKLETNRHEQVKKVKNLVNVIDNDEDYNL